MRATGDVVADADNALGNETGERRTNRRIGLRFSRQLDARACRLERSVRLFRHVQRNLELLPGDIDLSPALVVFALRHDLLIQQRFDPPELSLRQIERRLRVHDVRHALRIERLTGRETQARFDLCRIGFRFLQLRGRLRTRNPDEHCALGHVRSTLDRDRDDASGGLSADFCLFVGHK